MSEREDDLATVRRWFELVSKHGLNETECRVAEAEIWREFALLITNPVTGMISLQAPINYAHPREGARRDAHAPVLLTQRQMLMMIDEAQPERGVAGSGVVKDITGSIQRPAASPHLLPGAMGRAARFARAGAARPRPTPARDCTRCCAPWEEPPMLDETTPTTGVERGCGKCQTLIYGLVDPARPGEIRYVGKTVDLPARIRHHEWMARRGAIYPVHRWIREVLRARRSPEAVVLEVIEGEGWAEAERRWIAKLDNLTNISRGGEGVDAPRTPEWLQRIADAHRGKKISKETRKRLSEINLSATMPAVSGAIRGRQRTRVSERARTGACIAVASPVCGCSKRTFVGGRAFRVERSGRRTLSRSRPERGHRLEGDNVRISHRSGGRVERICRECVRIRNREYKRRR